MTTILGIDPGSRITGYGIIKVQGNQYQHIASGTIVMAKSVLSERLRQIFAEISDVIRDHLPEEAAIESVFMHQNPGGALKLGQARGAAIVAAANHALSVAEYSPRQIKQAVVGYGAAQKSQVQHMVKALLNIQTELSADAADALAVAICHSHCRQGLMALTGTRQRRRGRLR